MAGRAFRRHGGTQKLVSALGWWNMLAPSETHLPEVAELRQMALELLANLSSDAVDATSSETKRDLLECGGDLPLMACLKSTDDLVVKLACGALQNLCQDVAWCEVILENKAHTDLERLLGHMDDSTVKYASGALRNMQVALRAAGLPVPNLSSQAEESVALRKKLAAVRHSESDGRSARSQSGSGRSPRTCGCVGSRRTTRSSRRRRRAAAATAGGGDADDAIRRQLLRIRRRSRRRSRRRRRSSGC